MTDFCVKILALLQSWIMKLPDLSVQSSVLSQVTSAYDIFIEFIAKVNFLVPIPTILLVLSIVYGFRVSKFLVFLINWVIRRLADFFP